jgi:hypothetical protein
MSEAPDAQSVVADPSAPESVVTAATDTPEITTETPEAPAEETPPKTFTQEELDEIVAKRVAREARKIAREHAAKAEAAQGPKSSEIDPEYDYEGHIEAKAKEMAEEIVRDREANRERREIISAHEERIEQAYTRYDDFDRVALSPDVDVTTVMLETLMRKPNGPEIQYYLGSNPREATAISRLPPILQAAEIGALSAKLAAAPPPARKASSAPPPITPLTAKGATPAFDTTDPRAAASMDTSAWVAAENAREMRRLRGS